MVREFAAWAIFAVIIAFIIHLALYDPKEECEKIGGIYLESTEECYNQVKLYDVIKRWDRFGDYK